MSKGIFRTWFLSTLIASAVVVICGEATLCLAQSSILEKGTSGGAFNMSYSVSKLSNGFLVGLSYSARGQVDFMASAGRIHGGRSAVSGGFGVYPIKERNFIWPVTLGFDIALASSEGQLALATDVGIYRSLNLASWALVQFGAGFAYLGSSEKYAANYGMGVFSLGLFYRSKENGVYLGLTPSIGVGYVQTAGIGFVMILTQPKREDTREIDY